MPNKLDYYKSFHEAGADISQPSRHQAIVLDFFSRVRLMASAFLVKFHKQRFEDTDVMLYCK
jgi:hypothetical protein